MLQKTIHTTVLLATFLQLLFFISCSDDVKNSDNPKTAAETIEANATATEDVSVLESLVSDLKMLSDEEESVSVDIIVKPKNVFPMGIFHQAIYSRVGALKKPSSKEVTIDIYKEIAGEIIGKLNETLINFQEVCGFQNVELVGGLLPRDIFTLEGLFVYGIIANILANPEKAELVKLPEVLNSEGIFFYGINSNNATNAQKGNLTLPKVCPFYDTVTEELNFLAYTNIQTAINYVVTNLEALRVELSDKPADEIELKKVSEKFKFIIINGVNSISFVISQSMFQNNYILNSVINMGFINNLIGNEIHNKLELLLNSADICEDGQDKSASEALLCSIMEEIEKLLIPDGDTCEKYDEEDKDEEDENPMDKFRCSLNTSSKPVKMILNEVVETMQDVELIIDREQTNTFGNVGMDTSSSIPTDKSKYAESLLIVGKTAEHLNRFEEDFNTNQKDKFQYALDKLAMLGGLYSDPSNFEMSTDPAEIFAFNQATRNVLSGIKDSMIHIKDGFVNLNETTKEYLSLKFDAGNLARSLVELDPNILVFPELDDSETDNLAKSLVELESSIKDFSELDESESDLKNVNEKIRVLNCVMVVIENMKNGIVSDIETCKK